MASANREQDPALIERLRAEAHRFDFFQAVRVLDRFEQMRADKDAELPRTPVGHDSLPADEVVRFRSLPSFSFPGSTVHGIRPPVAPKDAPHPADEGRREPPDEMLVSFIGLTGPSGVLPDFYTQLLCEGNRVGQSALYDVLDMFHHRIVSLFYRAWEKYHVAPAFERSYFESARGDDLFTRSLYDLMGILGQELRTINLWDANNGRLLVRPRGYTSSDIHCLAFAPDGKHVAAAGNRGAVTLWDTHTGQASLSLLGHTGDLVFSVAYSPDGRRLASSGDDNTVRLWDAETGRQTHLLLGHSDNVPQVAFSPDGLRLVTASRDMTLRVWNVESGETEIVYRGHQRSVLSVAWSPDGRYVASAGGDHVVRLWDASSGQDISTLSGHEDKVWSVAFSPDGRQVASGSADRTVRLWDTAAPATARPFATFSGDVFSVAFSPDGDRLASADSDRSVKLWEVRGADRGKLAMTMTSNVDAVRTVVFSPDGKRVASAGHESQRLDVPGETLLYYAGYLADQMRSAAGLEDLLRDWLGIPVEVVQFLGRWLQINDDDVSLLPGPRHPEGRYVELGLDFTSGTQSWDVQSTFRLRLGPLTWEQFQSLLPVGKRCAKLMQMVQLYVGAEYDFDVHLLVHREEIGPWKLGRRPHDPASGDERIAFGRLGWDTWLAAQSPADYAQEVVFSTDTVASGEVPVSADITI